MKKEFSHLDEGVEIQHVIERLDAEFSPSMPHVAIVDTVEECVQRWSDAPIRTFVPLLTERRATEELRAAVANPSVRSPATV